MYSGGMCLFFKTFLYKKKKKCVLKKTSLPTAPPILPTYIYILFSSTFFQIITLRVFVVKIYDNIWSSLFFTLTHLYRSDLKYFFKYLDSTSTPTVSYSMRCVSCWSGHDVRFGLKTHNVPSTSSSCDVSGHVQFGTWQGMHLVRSADGAVPGEQRTHDFDADGEPLTSVSTTHKTLYDKI